VEIYCDITTALWSRDGPTVVFLFFGGIYCVITTAVFACN